MIFFFLAEVADGQPSLPVVRREGCVFDLVEMTLNGRRISIHVAR